VRLVSFARRRGTATANPAFYQLLSPSGAIVYSLRPTNEVKAWWWKASTAPITRARSRFSTVHFLSGFTGSGRYRAGREAAPWHTLCADHAVPVDRHPPDTSAIPGVTFRDFSFGACNIPANATAVALNVTLVPNGQFGYLSVWPGGQAQPVVSTMNSLDGRIKANAAIVGLGFEQGGEHLSSPRPRT
jgi:hypothetical protein